MMNLRVRWWRGPGMVMLFCVGVLGNTARADFSVEPALSTNVVGQMITLELLEDDVPASTAFGFAWSLGSTTLTNDGRISGAQTPVLRIEQATFEDAGTYSVTFTNVVDETNVVTVTKSAVVHVVDWPVVTDLVSETQGADVTFRVSATGGMLSYQWYWQGQAIEGATQSNLRFTNAYANANAGYYTVRVSNPVAPDGVFASGSLLFTKPTPSGVYQGLFYPETMLTLESSGFLQFTVSASRRFSGKVLLGRERYALSGVFPPDQFVEATATSQSAAPLALRLQLLTTNDTPQIAGELAGENWVSPVRACRLAFSAKQPTALAGRYTLVLQNTNVSPEAPNGDGCGTVVVRNNGTVAFSGRMPDNTPVKQTAGLSRLGEWPLYAAPSRGQGLVIGWLRVGSQSGGNIQGDHVGWIREPGPAIYPEGFALLLKPVGSTFIAPTTGPVVGVTNGVATVFGGDLFSGSDPVWMFVRTTLRPPARLVPEKGPEAFRFGIKKSTGQVQGSFINPATGKRANLWAAVLQQQNAIRGFFVSTNMAGSVQIVPAR